MMYNNGSVNNNIRYEDLCVERFAVSVAYNHDTYWFEFENDSMINLREKYGLLQEVGASFGQYSYDSEILSKFFMNYNILVNWINCNYTWGWFDDETGKWTGAVGQVVNSVFVCKHAHANLFMS